MNSADFNNRGFTLVELLLAIALGLVVIGVAVQLLLGEARSSGALARHFRLRGWQRRTLALVKTDLSHAASWSLRPESTSIWPCALSGRQPQLAIHPRNGAAPLLYSVGDAPSGIWRSPVLMRCGPAFDLYGRPSRGAYQNRVVLDGVDRFAVNEHPQLPVLLLQLEQRRGNQWVRSSGVG